MEEVTITTFITIAVMLLFSAFFSGMEIAFLGRNRLREEIDRKQNPLFNHIADIFARNSSNYITTILVGNNIALVIYSMFMSKMLLNGLNIENTLLQTILSTIVIIFIGEYIPKSIISFKESERIIVQLPFDPLSITFIFMNIMPLS